jgi:hypothetical protein
LEGTTDAVFRYNNSQKMGRLAKRWTGRLRVVDAKNAYLYLPDRDLTGDDLVMELKSVLQPADT